MSAAKRSAIFICAGLLSLAIVASTAIDSAGAGKRHQRQHKCANANVMPRSIGKRAFERAVICLTNQQRIKRGLRRLRGPQKQLRKAGARHNRVMLRKRCFAHQCPGEPSLQRRLERSRYVRSRYPVWMIGENLAWGSGTYGTPRALVRALMKSRPHRHNILNRRWRHIGVAVSWGYPAAPRQLGATISQEFGTRSRH